VRRLAALRSVPAAIARPIHNGRNRSTVDNRATTWLSFDGGVRVALGLWLNLYSDAGWGGLVPTSRGGPTIGTFEYEARSALRVSGPVFPETIG
jgi:hypothetical protein